MLDKVEFKGLEAISTESLVQTFQRVSSILDRYELSEIAEEIRRIPTLQEVKVKLSNILEGRAAQ